MESSNHKGSEYKNIVDTWDENERKSENANASGSESNAPGEPAAGNDLEQLIKQEASEYDNVNKEDRILGGDRATINDDGGAISSDE